MELGIIQFLSYLFSSPKEEQLQSSVESFLVIPLPTIAKGDDIGPVEVA